MIRFHPQSIATDAAFRGLAAVGDRVAWVSGTKGTVGRTTDGGETWNFRVVPGAELLDFRDVKAIDDRRAWILSIGPGDQSRIYRTNDAGVTWTLQFKNADKAAFYDCLAFWDDRHALALCDPVDDKYRIIKTSDGGDTWIVESSKDMPPSKKTEGAFAACLIAHGKSEAWFVTGGGGVARAFHSTDRGRSWSVADTPLPAETESSGAFAIAFADDKQGIIVGGEYKKPTEPGSAAITGDGGKTWAKLAPPPGYCSGVCRAGDGWVAVGTAGAWFFKDRWEPVSDRNFNVVRFAKNSGWAAGSNGRIARFEW